MRRGGVAVLALSIAACSPAAPAATASPSPTSVATAVSAVSPSPQHNQRGPFAVVIDTGGVGEMYYIQLVAADGGAGAFATPKSRSLKMYYFPPAACPAGGECAAAETAAYNLPEVSLSSTRVYYLDGETQIRSLTPSGVVQDVMNVDAPANSQVVFSVSPDDSRIAIATITLATSNIAASFHDVMYVEDTGTGAHRVDVYSSTTRAEWPVAWHRGKLVVGVGPSDIGSLDNPYGAVGYHVVDPATGIRSAALDCANGLLSPAGTACVSGFCPGGGSCGAGTIGRQGYDGAKTAFAVAGSPPRIQTGFAHDGELSPDGTRIAAPGVPTDPTQTAGDTYLVSTGSATLLTHAGSPLGWIDDTHLVLDGSFGRPYVIDTADPSIALSLVGGGLIVPNGLSLTVAGVVPTNLV